MGRWSQGVFNKVLVGATNVGSMTLDNEPHLVTNSVFEDRRKADLVKYKQPHLFKKGDEVGMFKLGSTVVLIFEAPENLEWTVEAGQSIKYGESFAKF
jgi:phosphatidylserine decarboxylase